MYLITGCKGQLGTELSKLLPNAICADIDVLDITDEKAVEDFVRENNIDVIINCAAYTAVDKAESDIDLAEKINIFGPKNLAKTGAKIIHISTDYVFDGTNHKPYQPDEKTNPVSVYGKTKRKNVVQEYEKFSTKDLIFHIKFNQVLMDLLKPLFWAKNLLEMILLHLS